MRQQIYSKKQKAGEYTLRFIDQFVNLVYRLPEQVTERQCVHYILNGIRIEIARMARTANIQTIDQLIEYVKLNYGQHDRMESRLAMKPPSNRFHPNLNRPKVEEFHEEKYYDDNENELWDEGVVNGDEVSDAIHDYQQENHASNSQISVAKMSVASNVSRKPSVGVNKTSNKSPEQQINVAQNPLNRFKCPYCDENHSYRQCPLPVDQKPRICFFCRSNQHLASGCPQRDTRPSITNSVSVQSQTETHTPRGSNTQNIETQVAALECALPPPVAYVRSVIFFPKDDPRPHATATVNNIELIGLLDTGSHVTVMGQNLYEAHHWSSNLLPHDTIVLTADGTKHEIMGMLLLQYIVNGKVKIVPTLVLPIVMKKIIFGVDFQRVFHMKMVMFDCDMIDAQIPKEQKVFDSHVLSTEQQSLLSSVINTIPVVLEDGVLNQTNLIEHSIDTGTGKPVYSRPYIFSPTLQTKIGTEINRMIRRGIIKKIPESSWLNPVVPVMKTDGTVRLCIDARKLNKITKKNRYNPTNIERIFSRIPTARYFSAIDLKDAYYQIPLSEKDQLKTAFSIHGMGMYAYRRMPQGLVNSAATLNRLVETMFNAETEPEIFVYVDDFIVCSENFERHIELLKIVSEKLKMTGLAIGLKKSKFCMKRLKFLGHEIDENGISIDSSRLQAITSYKKPTNTKEVRSFLGFAGWHRKFVENYAEISTPLVDLTKKSIKFHWSKEHEQAYQQLKEALLKTPFLCTPDYRLPFHVDTTSSSVGTGAVLYQMAENKKKVIAYMSTKLNHLQKKYHPIERECLALIVALEKFRYYIQGNKVVVTTDQCSINWLKNCTDPTGRIARWALRLQAYDFELKSKTFSQRELVSILCREIDMITTPYAFAQAIDKNYKSEIAIIDIINVTKSQDAWYVDAYNSVTVDSNNKYFKIVDNILYHRFDKLKNPYENEWKICVPAENRIDVIKEQHDAILASHPGYFKTLHRIQIKYYWPKMAHQICEYVNKCEICRTTKPSNVNVRTNMGKRRETDFPFRTLSVDFIGPMTMSKKQNQYIFVVIDNFTKFVCLKPMRVAKAEHVTRFLEDEVFLKYGVCENLICDNGVQFASKELNNLMNKYHSTLRFTPFYFPQANPCEIANKSIVNAIRSYVVQHEDQRVWDAEISAIVCALNCNIHTATNMSPFHALYGHEMILKGSEYAQIVDVNNNHCDDIIEKHATIRNSIREHLYMAYREIERTLSKKSGGRTIDLEKETYLKNMKLSNAGERYSKKLGPKYIPVKIVKQVGENTFIISDKNDKILGKYHSSLLMQR